jgi:LysR family transcriptional activator of nhaA
VAELSLHALDVVLADAPVAEASNVRAFSHLLGECGVTLLATKPLARQLRRGFPRSLDQAPMLLPTENTALRRSLDQWFEAHEVRPTVVGEFEDSALLGTFGQDGIGVFAVPTVIEKAVRRQYQVEVIGRATEIRERFYAITVRRRVEHPAVVAICEAAQEELFRRAPASPARVPRPARGRG